VPGRGRQDPWRTKFFRKKGPGRIKNSKYASEIVESSPASLVENARSVRGGEIERAGNPNTIGIFQKKGRGGEEKGTIRLLTLREERSLEIPTPSQSPWPGKGGNSVLATRVKKDFHRAITGIESFIGSQVLAKLLLGGKREYRLNQAGAKKVYMGRTAVRPRFVCGGENRKRQRKKRHADRDH